MFPYEELRDLDGNYFPSWKATSLAGYPDNQIWSVVEDNNVFTYGPPHHCVNVLGFIATEETHDGETYFTEDCRREMICSRCGDHTTFEDSPDDENCPDCYDMKWTPLR